MMDVQPIDAPRREIVLFATKPPSDDRPDAVTFHLTTRTHRQLLEMACRAVSRIPGAHLTIKRHPRCSDRSVFEEVLAEFPRLDVRIISSGDVRRRLRRASCVLSCASTSGIEAALAGVPVIELLPEGSHDLLPAKEWGGLGSARTEEELDHLLRQALRISQNEKRRVGVASAFANLNAPATPHVVDELLAMADQGVPQGPVASQLQRNPHNKPVEV